MPEHFEIVDRDGNPTGQLKARHEVHRDGDRHQALHVHLVNPRTRTIIFQQRSLMKDTFPGLLYPAASGHYVPGEKHETAMKRELGEELGITFQRDVFQMVEVKRKGVCGVLAGTMISIQTPRIHDFDQDEPLIRDHELHRVHFLLSSLEPTDLKLEKGELTAAVSFEIGSLKELLQGKRDSLAHVSAVSCNTEEPIEDDWSRKDFPAMMLGYFLQVLEIAERMIDGERAFAELEWVSYSK